MYSLSFKKKSKKLPEYFHTGSAQVDSYVRELNMCTACVTSVCIYKTPLEQMLVGTTYVVHHHYLIVQVAEVWHPGGRMLNGLYLRAEKVGQDDQGEDGNDVTAGITVKNVAIPEDADAEVHYRASDLCVTISMSQLVDILTAHSPNYDLVVDNCWKYADATVRALLTAFRDLQPEDARAMVTHIQQMPALVMPLETRAGQATVIAAITVCVAGMAGIIFCVYKGLSIVVNAAMEERPEEEE